MIQSMIFRDDDIGWTTDLERFKAIHELFVKYKVVHTIAVIAEDIDKHPDLIKYIKSTAYFNVQLHCWEHVELTECDNLDEQLKQAIEAMVKAFGRAPTVLFPPWNLSDDNVKAVARQNNLRVSADKISIAAYIRAGGSVSEKVVNFHYWADQETMMLETALRLFVQRRTKCV